MIEYALNSLMGDNSVGTVMYSLGRSNKKYDKNRPFLRWSAESISTKIKGVINLTEIVVYLLRLLCFLFCKSYSGSAHKCRR